MAEIGILGRRERAGTFSALGVRPYYAETARQAQEAFERMMKEECAVIFVDAEWQEALQAQALRCRDRVLPAVLFLPGEWRCGGRGAAGSRASCAGHRCGMRKQGNSNLEWRRNR